MSNIVKKFAVIDTTTSKDRVVYDNQAPATALAKNISRGKTMLVEERTYELVSTRIVRTVRDREIVKA